VIGLAEDPPWSVSRRKPKQLLLCWEKKPCFRSDRLRKLFPGKNLIVTVAELATEMQERAFDPC
jgi:hypothetical protein